MNTPTNKNTAVSRILDVLVSEDMKGHEQIRAKMETLLLGGKLDDRALSTNEVRFYMKIDPTT